MDPAKYDAQEWKALTKQLTVKQLRSAVKRAYRSVSKSLIPVAVSRLRQADIAPTTNQSDWEKGVRYFPYSKGGGFMVTVKGIKGKSMHVNRFGLKRPILMWSEGGTKQRKTRAHWGRKPRNTGAMPATGFIDKAAPEMYSKAISGLFPAVEKAVENAAKKAGF